MTQWDDVPQPVHASCGPFLVQSEINSMYSSVDQRRVEGFRGRATEAQPARRATQAASGRCRTGALCLHTPACLEPALFFSCSLRQGRNGASGA